MKRALVIWFFVAALVAMGCSPPPDSFGSVGTLQDSWVEIWDWYDLDAVRTNLSASYILMTDLDSTSPGYDELAGPAANGGQGWAPIGDFQGGGFRANFNGQGYEIGDWFIRRPSQNGLGLFSRIDFGAVVENVGVVDATVSGYASFVGGLVYINDGTVDSCYFIGSVTGESTWILGGLVGVNRGTVSNSYSAGNVTGEFAVGGLVGENRGTVSNSKSTATVTAVGTFGGLVGFNEHSGTVNNCYFDGSVTGNGRQVGGLLGVNRGVVGKCYSAGSVTGREYVGGLVGRHYEGTLSNSFWDIETSGQTSSDGGTGKTTVEMMDLRTFSDPLWSLGLHDAWSIIGVADETQRDTDYIWNIVDTETYPFLSWEPIAGVQTQCAESATGTGEVCITTSHGFIEDLEALPSIPPAPPADIAFPHGVFSFKVTGLELGQTVTITVELPDPVRSSTRWWKEHMGAWYSIPVTVVEPNIISFTLTDGVFPGDSDNAEDGVITDPGGPGSPLSLGYTVGWETQPINKSAVSAPWIALLAAIAGASLLALRRRRGQEGI